MEKECSIEVLGGVPVTICEGKRVVFNVHFPSDRSIDVRVTREAKAVEMDGSEEAPGFWRINFAAAVSGEYELRVIDAEDGKQLCSEKIAVRVVDDLHFAALQSKVKLAHSASFKALQDVVFEVEFPFHAAKKLVEVLDASSRPVTLKKEVVLRGDAKTIRVASLRKNAPVHLKCSFRPAFAGEYEIRASIGGVLVPGTPIRISVSTAGDDALEVAKQCRVVIADQKREFVTLQGLEFEIVFPPDMPAEDLLAIQVSKGELQLACDGSEIEPGRWKCTTSPCTVAGEYTIAVKVGDQFAGNCPFVVHVADQHQRWAQERIVAEGAGLEEDKCCAWGRAPFRLMFPVELDESLIAIEAFGPKGECVEDIDGEQEAPGIWVCYFRPVVAGEHTVSVRIGEHVVRSFPRKVRIALAKATFLSKIVCSMDGLAPITWDEKCSFEIGVPHVLPKEALVVQATHPGADSARDCVCDAFNDEGLGTWSFDCRVAGVHLISITLDGEHVEGSPFSVNVQDLGLLLALNASVSGDGVIGGLNTCGYATDFLLDFKDVRAASHIEIQCKDPDGKAVAIDGTPTEGDTVWKVDYLPPVSGLYRIFVAIGGHVIKGAPFAVDIKKSVGGRGIAMIFLSSVSGKKRANRDLNMLHTLFAAKIIQPRYIVVDTMSRDDREELFSISGTRELPFVFINDNFVGGPAELQQLEDDGDLDAILHRMMECALKPVSCLEKSVSGAGKARQFTKIEDIEFDEHVQEGKEEEEHTNENGAQETANKCVLQ